MSKPLADPRQAAIHHAIAALYEGRYLDSGKPDITAMIAEDGFISDGPDEPLDLLDTPAWDWEKTIERATVGGTTQVFSSPPNGWIKAADVRPKLPDGLRPTWVIREGIPRIDGRPWPLVIQ
jgi:hypothetical protein